MGRSRVKVGKEGLSTELIRLFAHNGPERRSWLGECACSARRGTELVRENLRIEIRRLPTLPSSTSFLLSALRTKALFKPPFVVRSRFSPSESNLLSKP